MALVLTLTHGSTTVTLNSAAAHCEIDADHPYTPESADETEPFISESFGVVIQHNTVNDVRATIQTIYKAFLVASLYQENNVGDRVYINCQPGGYAGAYRSELIDGKLELDEDATWNIEHNLLVTGTIAWTRRNYWEGELTQIPISNVNGSNNTAGLFVSNCNDMGNSVPTKRCNYFDIAALFVDGDLPAPVKICMNGGAIDLAKIYWFNNVNSNPTTLSHWIELGGAADATCSNGDYKSVVATASATTSVDFGTITPANFAGNFFKILIGLKLSSGALTAYKFQPWVSMGGSEDYLGAATYYTPKDTTYFYSLDLGAMRLPPVYQGGETYGGTVHIGIKITNPTGANVTWFLDWAMMGCMDGFLTIDHPQVAACLDAHYHLDGTEGYYWVMYDNDDAHGVDRSLTGVNDHLVVYPAKAQRFYLRMGDHIGGDSPLVGFTTRAWYRPRRLTL